MGKSGNQRNGENREMGNRNMENGENREMRKWRKREN